MVKPEQVALVLLAAGRSRRFDGDKLSEEELDARLDVLKMANLDRKR